MISKLPPQALDAEESFLAACIHGDAVQAVELLAADDFYRTTHREIFSAVCAMVKAGVGVDLVSLASWLSDKNKLDPAGGAANVSELFGCPIAVDLEAYAGIIKTASIKRNIIELCSETVRKCYDGESIIDILPSLQDRLARVDQNAAKDSWLRVGDLQMETFDRWEAAKSKKGIIGVDTGLVDIDNALGGFQPGELYLLGARPGMGKSAFAFKVALSAASKNHAVGVISIEMSRTQVISRQISDLSGVDGSRFRTGDFEAIHWQKINAAYAKISGSPLYIDDTPTANIRGVQRKIRTFVQRYSTNKTPLIIIDYLQYIEGIKSERKDLEIGTVTRGLKAIARELNIPILLLSQLSREVEKRENKRPTRSDLRNSGEIEQDADVIAFLYRDEYYNPGTDQRGVVEFIIDKFRAGRTGTIKLAWISHRTTFENLANGGMGDA